jgi:hypothetical protein
MMKAVTGADRNITGDNHLAAVQVMLDGEAGKQRDTKVRSYCGNQHREEVKTRAKIHIRTGNTGKRKPLLPAIDASALV